MKSNQFALFYQSSKILWKACNTIFNHPDFKNFQLQYIADEHSIDQVTKALKIIETNIEDSSQYLFREQLLNITDIEKSFKAHLQKKKSKAPVLILLEMTWSIRSPSAAIYIKEFYLMMDTLRKEESFTICYLYNCNILLDELLLTALQSHPYIWSNNRINENQYFVPLKITAKRDGRAQFNYWLSKINPSFSPKQTKPIKNLSGNIQPIYNTKNAPSTAIAISDEGRWKIRCLGKLKVYREYGELINWNSTHGSTRKIKTLFAYLLYKGERGATAEELADMLWPNDDITISMNRLYHNIRFLKIALSPTLKNKKEVSPFIIREDKHYQLALPPNSWIDLSMFQELCFRGNAHFKNNNYKEALICYQSAERLYLGELLQDIPNKYIDNMEHDWCWSRRQWYKEMHLKLLLESSIIYKSQNNITEALACCDKALSIAPYSEKINIEKLLIFYQANRKDAFQRQFKVYSNTLQKFDMGQPPTSIQDIYQKYLSKF